MFFNIILCYILRFISRRIEIYEESVVSICYYLRFFNIYHALQTVTLKPSCPSFSCILLF